MPDPNCHRTAVQVLRLGLIIANQAVVQAIEQNAVRVRLPEPGRWYDCRPMVDPREHSAEVIDMAVEAIAYGESSGLLHRHPVHRHLLRLPEQA